MNAMQELDNIMKKDSNALDHTNRKERILISNNGSDDETESEAYKKITESRSPRPYSCCGEIWCTCNNIEEPNYPEFDEDSDVAQENEPYYLEQHAEDIISHYS